MEELTSSTTLTEEAEDADEDDLFFRADDEEDDDLFGSSLVSDQAASAQDALFETPPETHQDDTPAIDAIDPELLQCFCEETEEHLENIDSCLNSLSDQVTDSVQLSPSTQETLHSLRRSVHTLKGAAAVIGIDQVAAWGHDFEDFLDWLHDEARRLDPATVAALREGADLLASLADEPTFPAGQEKQRITAKFADITDAFSVDAPVGKDVDKEDFLGSVVAGLSAPPDDAFAGSIRSVCG